MTEDIQEQLHSSAGLQVTIRPEDRLASTLNQRAQIVASWVHLREQLDTAEALATADVGGTMADSLEKEIKAILDTARRIHARLKILNKKVVQLTSECNHPLRADLQRGFPADMREQVAENCFDA